MFTGIVEDMGKVLYIRKDKISVAAGFAGEVKSGDSIMVDGVCLTASAADNKSVMMDIGMETLRSTALKKLRPGSRVNLERAMRLSDRIDGHIVYGHVMEVGKIISRKIIKNTVEIKIRSKNNFVKKLLLKGSVAVNGVSLTVNSISGDVFSVGIIPETASRTNLGFLQASDEVNLEADMLVSALKI